jgi:hypothetical protein
MPNTLQEILTPSTSSCATEPSSTATSLVHQQFPSTILEQETFEDDPPSSLVNQNATITTTTTDRSSIESASNINIETFSTPLNHLHPAKLNSNGNTSDEPTSDENIHKSSSSSSSPDSRINSNDVTSESQMLVTASEGEYSFKTESNIENTITNMTNNGDEIVEIEEHQIITTITTDVNEINLVYNTDKKGAAVETKNDTTTSEDDGSVVQADQSNISSSSADNSTTTPTAKQNNSSTSAAVENVLNNFNEILVIEENKTNDIQTTNNQEQVIEEKIIQTLDKEAESKYMKIEEEEVSSLVNKIVFDVITQAVDVPAQNTTQITTTTTTVLYEENEPTATIQSTDILSVSFTKNETPAEEQSESIQAKDINIVEIISNDSNKLSSSSSNDLTKPVTAVAAVEAEKEIAIDHLNETTPTTTTLNTTTASTTTNNKKGRQSSKKEPVVDCFSCTIA